MKSRKGFGEITKSKFIYKIKRQERLVQYLKGSYMLVRTSRTVRAASRVSESIADF